MKRYYPIVCMVLLIASQTGCKKGFLDIVPKGYQVATKVEDYDLLMNSSNFYFYQAAGGLREFVLMGDDIAAEGDLFGKQEKPQTPRAFRWDALIWDNKDYPLDLNTQTGNLYTINKIINEVLSSEGDDARKKSLQAEAKASRAFLNFLLVNSYGKPYNPATAASDPAFPLIVKADISQSGFKRATVQEMYDFIIKDLTEAIALLPVQAPAKTRFSKGAAEALLAKVSLFMGKYPDALTQIKTAFTDVMASPLKPRLYDYNVEFAPGGKFLPIDSYSGPAGPFNDYTDQTQAALTMVYMGGSYDGNPFENDGLVLDPKAQALFEPSDLRLNFYSDIEPNGTPNPGGRLRPYGIRYIRIGIELNEMYLIKAECEARTGDLANAVTDVETLRQNRMPAGDAPVSGAITGDQAALTKFIIEEREREFAFTGFRWFDMRRLSVDPLFAGATYTHTLYDPAGNKIYTLKQPERWVLQIPATYIEANPGMVNNP
ncbi:RagB/SusD family nutrient uptake outer membrane protein [Flavitalea sp. BT771]|uniref:RagB/SusD family nutrient uptake outer membrane protein n=1 Tax=Flavitalea sp. BT771 TaxID=3063329 RepID=UPI0026E3796D|nr:RagB/SusD family nutrient uptake outer membrane protein [Flavitalea sp. BT771]MDO6432346.1 RagB/SusD family nutrient uptake outer membrane protein [Flavitalea sp. BT771]MDV6221256.1 RagB/SusD family nutrient uptake outer membrane protein [Flavitalea sp. BT771]